MQFNAEVQEKEGGKLRLHYSRLFYRAVLHTTKMALRKACALCYCRSTRSPRPFHLLGARPARDTPDYEAGRLHPYSGRMCTHAHFHT